jgi:hypothetical protein
MIENKKTRLTEQVEDGKHLVPIPQYRADRYHMPHNPNRPGLAPLPTPIYRFFAVAQGDKLTGTSIGHDVTHPSELFDPLQHLPASLLEGLKRGVLLLFLVQTDLGRGEVRQHGVGGERGHD